MGGVKTKINLSQLQVELKTLNNRKALYKVLKEGLSRLGYWKERGRGKPFRAKSW